MQPSEKYLTTRADYAVQPPFSFHPGMAFLPPYLFQRGGRDEDDDVGLCQLFLLESRMLPPNKNPSLFFPSLLYRARLKGGPPGLVNFVTAVAFHFFLALPAALTQPGDHLLTEPCTL